MRTYIISLVTVIVFGVNFFNLNSARPALAADGVENQVLWAETAVMAHNPSELLAAASVNSSVAVEAVSAVEATSANVAKTAKAKTSFGGAKFSPLAM